MGDKANGKTKTKKKRGETKTNWVDMTGCVSPSIQKKKIKPLIRLKG
jgi:hypothetical protein